MSPTKLDLIDYFFLFKKYFVKPILVYFNIDVYSQLCLDALLLHLYKFFFFFEINISYIVFIKTFSIGSIIFALKFLLFIAILIFVRGGIPRYRYDFLTKLGWIKTLTLTIIFFLNVALLIALF